MHISAWHVCKWFMRSVFISLIMWSNKMMPFCELISIVFERYVHTFHLIKCLHSFAWKTSSEKFNIPCLHIDSSSAIDVVIFYYWFFVPSTPWSFKHISLNGMRFSCAFCITWERERTWLLSQHPSMPQHNLKEWPMSVYAASNGNIKAGMTSCEHYDWLDFGLYETLLTNKYANKGS